MKRTEDIDIVGTRAQALARRLCDAIECGELRAGTWLPSTRTLASKYGVSRGTVQVALQELEKRNLIETRPRQGGWIKPAKSVKIPRPSSKQRIGMILVRGLLEAIPPGTASPSATWASQIVHGFHQAVAEQGWDLLTILHSPEDKRGSPFARIDELENELAGILFFSGPSMEGWEEELDRRHIPWVTINRSSESYTRNFVAAGNVAGGQLVGRCLGRMGRHRVLLLSSPVASSTSSRDKCRGLIDGLIETGATLSGINYVFCTDTGEATGYRAVQQYLAQHPAPQAIYAAGDLWAVGAMNACRERGLRVPEDVAVIGTTGLQLAKFTSPSLTVLRQPMGEMGRKAGEMLLSILRQETPATPGQIVPTQLIVRESFPVEPHLMEELARGLDVETAAGLFSSR